MEIQPTEVKDAFLSLLASQRVRSARVSRIYFTCRLYFDTTGVWSPSKPNLRFISRANTLLRRRRSSPPPPRPLLPPPRPLRPPPCKLFRSLESTSIHRECIAIRHVYSAIDCVGLIFSCVPVVRANWVFFRLNCEDSKNISCDRYVNDGLRSHRKKPHKFFLMCLENKFHTSSINCSCNVAKYFSTSYVDPFKQAPVGTKAFALIVIKYENLYLRESYRQDKGDFDDGSTITNGSIQRKGINDDTGVRIFW